MRDLDSLDVTQKAHSYNTYTPKLIPIEFQFCFKTIVNEKIACNNLLV